MICDMCGKKKKKTFHREGGPLTAVEAKERGIAIANDRVITPYSSVCLPCINTSVAKGKFIQGKVITNPTVMPSGDQFEWVINDE